MGTAEAHLGPIARRRMFVSVLMVASLLAACGAENGDAGPPANGTGAAVQPTEQDLAGADLLGEWNVTVTVTDVQLGLPEHRPNRRSPGDTVERVYVFQCAEDADPCRLQVVKEFSEGTRPPVDVTEDQGLMTTTDALGEFDLCVWDDGSVSEGSVHQTLSFRVTEAEPDGDGWRAAAWAGEGRDESSSDDPDCPGDTVSLDLQARRAGSGR